MSGSEFDRFLGRAVSKRDELEEVGKSSKEEYLQQAAEREARRQQLLPEVELLLATLKVFGPKFDYPDSVPVRFGRVTRGWELGWNIPLRADTDATMPEGTNCMVIGADGNIYPGFADTYRLDPDDTRIGTSNGMWHKPKKWQTFPFDAIPVGEVSDDVLESILRKIAGIVSDSHLELEWEKLAAQPSD